jgi:hypothetical protein
MAQINPEGYKKTEETIILSSFYDTLLYLFDKMSTTQDQLLNLLSIIIANLDVEKWTKFEFESEELGKISLPLHYRASKLKLELCLEEIVGILIKCYTKVASKDPEVRTKSTKNLLELIEKNCSSFDISGFNLINEFNIMKLILIVLDACSP